MARPSRIITTFLFAITLGMGFTPAAQAHPTQPPTTTSTPADNHADQVAPGRENLEPTEPGFDDNNVDNQTGKNWHPTTNPKSKITPGKMRSDKEQIPGGFTKEQANQAEIQEAKEQATQTRSGVQTFAAVDNCRTYWPSPFKVCGKIREKYDSLGGPKSFLTWPKSNELGVPDGVGRRNEFVNGFIYWHPQTGAHPITTHFSVVWARNGWERGELGYPTTDEFALPDGTGRKQSFSKGHIYGSLAGLAAIKGAIYDKWLETGAEQGQMLSYPIEDETSTPDGVGKFSRFVWGFIYWSPATGAHPIYGPVLYEWANSGFEKGKYGYPTADIKPTKDGGDLQYFQRGLIRSPNFPLPAYQEISAFGASRPASRSTDSEEVIGDNFDRMHECIGGYDNGKLTVFHHSGVSLYCRDLWHIADNHMPPQEEITRQVWEDFQTCVAHTLLSQEFTNKTSRPGTYLKTRYNTYSKVRSYAIVWSSSSTLHNAYTNDDRGGRDWGGCRKYLPR